MENWFKEFIKDLIENSSHLTERALEIITTNLGTDDIAYFETHKEQIEYLKEVLEND